MQVPSLNAAVAALVIFLCSCSTQVQAQSPVDNGEFDHQFASSPDWWWGHGGCSVVRTSEQARNGNHSAAVSDRTAYWQGAAQELSGDLTIGKDYHFQCWVRTKDVPSGVLRIEVVQTDDRGQRFFPIAKTLANDSQWTLLEGGFQLLANGNLDHIAFVISGDYTDQRLFDYYVDSVTITENDWRAAADQRIEQFRKRDVVLNFEDADGNSISDVDIEIEQIGHRFAFGSALNDGFLNNPVYADFFQQNFEWATIEYFAQWIQTELVQGVEDYSLVDATVDFAEENGIQLRGHALTWPDTRFMPQWLIGQSAQTHLDEINERIDNVVSRYAGRLVHWDVNNEMLNFTYFEDVLGANIRSDMFVRAKQNDPNVKLFTNEFGLTQSGYKTDRYRQLVQDLQSAGADVGGIGLQSHFDSNVSPKALELTLAKLTDLGPEIWFTEYDASNPDPVERAKLLETFYRYAFSVPEAEGIIMWGFWAGSHWRGPDSAIVDSDWTVNAAGQKYFELLDQWTTQVSTSVSGGNSSVSFRGFHGNYLVRTTTQGTVNHHIISVEPQSAGEGAVNITLKHNTDPEADQALVVYGTPADDRFSFDLARPTMVKVNGVISSFPDDIGSEKITFVGNEGDDQLEIIGSDAQEDFFMAPARVVLLGTDQQVIFTDLAEVVCQTDSDNDRMTIRDSLENDVFVSYPDETIMFLDGRSRAARGFGNVNCRSRNGSDTVFTFDAETEDIVQSDFDSFIDLRDGLSIRRFFDFQKYMVSSDSGEDLLAGKLAGGNAVVNVSVTESEFMKNGNVFTFSDFEYSSIVAADNGDQSVMIDVERDASQDRVYVTDEFSLLRMGTTTFCRLTGFRDMRSRTAANDLLFVQDSPGNDTAEVMGDQFRYESDAVVVQGSGTGRTIARSSRGGTDSVSVSGAKIRFVPLGNWNSN